MIKDTARYPEYFVGAALLGVEYEEGVFSKTSYSDGTSTLSAGFMKGDLKNCLTHRSKDIIEIGADNRIDLFYTTANMVLRKIIQISGKEL